MKQDREYDIEGKDIAHVYSDSLRNELEYTEILYTRKQKSIHDHEKWKYPERYMEEWRPEEYKRRIVPSHKECVEKEKEIYVFLLVPKKRIVYYHTSESDDGKYAVYDKKHARQSALRQEKEDKKTIDDRKNYTIGTKYMKDGFVFFLPKHKKDDRDDKRDSKSDIVKYLWRIKELIYEIYAIDKAVKGDIKEEECKVVWSFLKELYDAFYTDTIRFFVIVDMLLMRIILFFYEER